MFNHTHYVPILRWKRAERVALRELRPTDKHAITPLVELIPRDFVGESVEGTLSKKVREIAQCWGSVPIFVDLTHLENAVSPPNGTHLLDTFATVARNYGLRVVPVTGLARNSNYQAAVASAASVDGWGACVRLRVSQITDSSFATDLDELLSDLGLNPGEIDLLIDYEAFDSHSASIVNVCPLIPELPSWRTFTVAGGAFPRDLSELEKNRQHELPRLDWQVWREAISSGLPRLPTFSDYTIQHGVYREPPGRANFSASIR